MKVYTTYILYSSLLNRYYVGSTSMGIESRIKRHNSNHSGFTGKAPDWEVVYISEFETVSESRMMEKKIKGRGARRYISDHKK